jgi:pimeloyl-ACP methyl ester carboxylesterase
MANKTDALVQEMPVARAPSTGIHSRFVVAGGLKTHFLEPGSGFPVVLLHSGEFAACAELSWKQTIRPLAEHFRVIAPDWAGFGKTEKVFSFDDMWGFRIRHVTPLVQVLGLESAHFIGNSMGGTLLRSDPRVYFDGVAVGCIACAAGWQAAGHTLATLRSIAHALRGWPTPLGVALNTSINLFDETGACIDASAKAQLDAVGRQVVEFALQRRGLAIQA